jgi:hypothetical protein
MKCTSGEACGVGDRAAGSVMTWPPTEGSRRGTRDAMSGEKGLAGGGEGGGSREAVCAQWWLGFLSSFDLDCFGSGNLRIG